MRTRPASLRPMQISCRQWRTSTGPSGSVSAESTTVPSPMPKRTHCARPVVGDLEDPYRPAGPGVEQGHWASLVDGLPNPWR